MDSDLSLSQFWGNFKVCSFQQYFPPCDVTYQLFREKLKPDRQDKTIQKKNNMISKTNDHTIVIRFYITCATIKQLITMKTSQLWSYCAKKDFDTAFYGPNWRFTKKYSKIHNTSNKMTTLIGGVQCTTLNPHCSPQDYQLIEFSLQRRNVDAMAN